MMFEKFVVPGILYGVSTLVVCYLFNYFINKYFKGKKLNSWIISNMILVSAILVVFVSAFINNDIFSKVFEYFGYSLIVLAFCTRDLGLAIRLNIRKVFIKVIFALGIIYLSFLFIFMIIKNGYEYLPVYFITTFTTHLLVSIAVLNPKTIKKHHFYWSPVLLMQIVTLVIYVIYIMNVFVIRGTNLNEILVFHYGINDIMYISIVFIFLDVIGQYTIIKSLNPRLEIDDRLFRTAFDISGNINVVFNIKTAKIFYANPMFLNKFKYSIETLNDYSLKILFEDEELIEEKVSLFFENRGSDRTLEFNAKMISGENIVIDCLVLLSTINLVSNSDYCLVTIFDLENTFGEYKKYEQLANYDPLTELANRRLIEKVFNKKQETNEEFAVIIFDIDHFKKINDKYGHVSGDEVLRLVASNLTKYNKNNDVVGRLGGDEFILLINYENEEHLKSISKDILKEYDNEIIIRSNKIQISISMGISLFPKDARSFEDLFEKADNALYQAKEHSDSKSINYKF